MPSKKSSAAPSAAPLVQKASLPLSAEALFRHGVVSQVLGRVLGGELKDAAVCEVVSCSHMGLDGAPRKTTSRTVYRWLAAFTVGGAAALEPAAREKTATSEVLSERFLAFLRTEKGADARAGIPELIRRARADGVLTADEHVDRVSVWRACQRMGLPLGQRSTKKDRDSRRFAYPHRMMLLLCDGKYFRAGIGRVRRIALFYIDDATRYVMAVVVGTDGESTELFLRGLYELCRGGDEHVEEGHRQGALHRLEALGRVGNALVRERPDDWPGALGRLRWLDWSRANTAVWEGRALYGGRLSRNAASVVLTANAIKLHLGLEFGPEELRLEQHRARRLSRSPQSSIGGVVAVRHVVEGVLGVDQVGLGVVGRSPLAANVARFGGPRTAGGLLEDDRPIKVLLLRICPGAPLVRRAKGAHQRLRGLRAGAALSAHLEVLRGARGPVRGAHLDERQHVDGPVASAQ